MVYLYKHRKVTQQEQQLIFEANRDAKTPVGITNFSTKQTPVYKWCMSRDSVRGIHVTFQGMVIKEIILAETNF